jgi:hypothetical protein
VVFVGGGVIGHYLLKPPSEIIPVAPPIVSKDQPIIPKDTDTQKLTFKNTLNEMTTEISNLKASMEQTKIDYENIISKEKSTRLKAEQELNDLKQTLAKKTTESSLSEPEIKPKKLSPMAQLIKSQIEKKLKDRIKKLNEKAYLSIYQQEEINKLIEAQAERITELTQQMLSGEGLSEESMKELGESEMQSEKKLQEILTQQQYSVYKELLEEERKEQKAQTIKLYMDGTVGMKGITESLSLSDEQKQKVQSMLEEKFNNYKPDENPQVNTPELPFDNKGLVEKIRGILTPEQYPKFDEYLKKQEEFKKMVEPFMPKKRTTAPTEPEPVISPTITTITDPISK